ncbi:MAG TPA: cupin domain-containing protein [Fibrella sp.]|jgi:quercetin dioxygenase-like cupin family protein
MNMAHSDKIIRNNKTGQQIRFIQTSRDTNGQLLEMEATFRAGSVRPAAHYHPNQVEDFTVVAGQLTVQIDGQTRTLGTGDTLHVSRNTVHAMWNGSENETIVNWQVRPALDTESFFETVFELSNEGKTAPDGMPPLLQRVLLAQHFSAVFRLAKPAPVIQRLVFGVLSPVARLAGYRVFQ